MSLSCTVLIAIVLLRSAVVWLAHADVLAGDNMVLWCVPTQA